MGPHRLLHAVLLHQRKENLESIQQVSCGLEKGKFDYFDLKKQHNIPSEFSSVIQFLKLARHCIIKITNFKSLPCSPVRIFFYFLSTPGPSR